MSDASPITQPFDDTADRITARALLAIVEHHLRWTRTETGGDRVPKSSRHIAADTAALDVLLRVLVEDLRTDTTTTALRTRLEDIACRHQLLVPDEHSGTGYDAPDRCTLRQAHAAIRAETTRRTEPFRAHRSPVSGPRADGNHVVHDVITGTLFWLQDDRLHGAPPADLPGQLDLRQSGPIVADRLTPDLAAHLRLITNHLRAHAHLPGSLQVFTGSWLRQPDGTYRRGCPGRQSAVHDGYPQFVATASVAHAIVATHNTPTGEGDAQLSFDGDDIIVAHLDDTLHPRPDARRVAPNPDGTYTIGFGWCWEHADPDQVADITT